MATILVAGLVNIETTLQVDRFPIDYSPIRYPLWGVDSTVSGVGYNVAKALTALGDNVRFVALISGGEDGERVRRALARDGIAQEGVLSELQGMPRSVILYEVGGRRQINVDLKDIQDRHYPGERLGAALLGCDLAALCNLNLVRPFLPLARERGVPVATDVHAVRDLEDPYNRDFMAEADILFMSDELIPEAPEAWAERVLARYRPRVLVIGLGARGALLALRDGGSIQHFEPVYTRPVVGTIGAGDALFSAFVHFYARGDAPAEALARAMVFTSFKLGAKGAADGFLSEAELVGWIGRTH